MACACLVTVSREGGIYCVDCGRRVLKTSPTDVTRKVDFADWLQAEKVRLELHQELTALVELTSALLADHAGYVTHAYWDGLPSQPPAPDQVPSLELRLKVLSAIRSAKEKLSK